MPQFGKYNYGLAGLNHTLTNLKTKSDLIKNKTKKGLIKGGLRIESASKQNAPIDTGNLRASGYTTWSGKTVSVPDFSKKNKDKTKLVKDHSKKLRQAQQELNDRYLAVEVGFTAHYAIHVHEIKKNYHMGDWKYLERAIAENETAILSDIASEAKGFLGL